MAPVRAGMSALLACLLTLSAGRAMDTAPLTTLPAATVSSPSVLSPTPTLAGSATSEPGDEDEDGYNPCFFIWQRDLQTIRWLDPEMRCPFPGPFCPSCGTNSCRDLFNGRVGNNICVALDGAVRGYYLNDQRIQWSGVEAVFGAEGVLRPHISYKMDGWQVSAEGEFFLNQPFGRSILTDPQRQNFRSNFDVDTFQIFQLYAQASYEDFYVRIGKSRTPFGAYSSPMFTNRLIDAPFIRTDVIQWTETGVFAHYAPGWLSLDVALTNGEPDLDTNSSKAIIGRVGVDQDTWGFGLSGKYHDGISSEFLKRYNNHVGIDAHVCIAERFVLYGEALYDEYGFHRNFFKLGRNNPDSLGPRSIYIREVFKGDKSPVIGKGYYVGLSYRGDKWLLDGTFGGYHPEQLNVLGHDDPIYRAVLKGSYNITPNLQVYGVAIIENRRENIELLENSSPYAIVGGMQFLF